MAAIARGDYSDAASRLHYPPTYTEDERREDIRAVSASLRLIIEDFGAPTALHATEESPSVLEVATGGGDVPYWSSLGPLSSLDRAYVSTFEKLGPGYLIVRFVRSRSMASPVIHRVSFCLPISATSADQLIETSKKLLRAKNVPLPENIDALLRKSLVPFEAAQ